MKFLLLCSFLLAPHAMALDAVITVLETPLLKYPSYDAPVMQYVRKGDVIKIHPSLANDQKYDQYAPAPEKLAQLKKKMLESPEYNQDPLFPGEKENTFYLEDEFIPTLDRQGNTAYIISEHVYVYFADARELKQNVITSDPTDYRLEEPLPKNYPLKTRSGYRGQFIMGLTQPYFESYPYFDSFKTKGYTSPVDLNLTFVRQAPGNYQERLFIGGTMNLRFYENSYTFEGERLSREQGLKFGLGPTISYDAFKGEKNRINLSATIIVNIVDRLNIEQRQGVTVDNRLYSGNSVVPRLALQYHRKQILEDIDLVLGTAMEIGTATSFRAKNAGSRPAWWQDLANDKFTTRTTFTLGGYVGVQSAY
jgi:hypothetical protein